MQEPRSDTSTNTARPLFPNKSAGFYFLAATLTQIVVSVLASLLLIGGMSPAAAPFILLYSFFGLFFAGGEVAHILTGLLASSTPSYDTSALRFLLSISVVLSVSMVSTIIACRAKGFHRKHLLLLLTFCCLNSLYPVAVIFLSAQ